MKLHDWQIPTVQRMVDALGQYRVSANTSDTGTGKTVMTCFAAKRLERSLCVVCPKSVIPSWEEAAELTRTPVHFITNYEKVIRAPRKKEWEAVYKSREEWGKMFRFARWEVYKRTYRWMLPQGSLLVFDEAHRTSGQTSQNSKLLIAAVRQQIPTVLLSATLAESPLKMKAIGYALGFHKVDSYRHEFVHWLSQNHCAQNTFGAWEYQGGAAHMENLRHRAGTRVCGVRTADLGDRFPSNQVIPRSVPVPDPGELDIHYLEALREMEEEAESEIVAALRARQISETSKIPAIVEMAKDAEADGCSVFIAVNFLETHNEILSRLGRDQCSFICGGQAADLRQEEIETFQNNARHFMVATIQAGGQGVSLHDVSGRPRVALISPSHSAVDFRQTLGRIHRAGGLSPAVQSVLFAAGSEVETRIRRNLQFKLRNLDALNDADFSINPNPNAET